MNPSSFRRVLMTLAGWTIALAFFLPIAWMVLASFKTEVDAIAAPSLVFSPTIENYVAVHQRADYVRAAVNSLYLSLGGTALALLLGIPAAYRLAFFPTRHTRTVLVWMISTRMLPAAGVLVPMYLLFTWTRLIDTHAGLIVVYALMNAPILIWLLFSFFREIPTEILDAARIDGASARDELRHILLPLALPGIASASLLSIVLCWNEAFWSLNLTTVDAAPLTTFIASFSAPEGLFWAKLSAASTLAVAPILALGWLSQRHLVRGLTFGAVK
ncbi:MAG: carbohydrate ABC transporter permease [Rhodothermales bacterium]|nr:carbohydrate ABC transporter permease [Rhodothermales bacterium]